jgi:hypothetical protein
MSDATGPEPTGPSAASPGAATDTPVGTLQTFELEPDEQFVAQVGRRIERRLLTGELVTLSAVTPVTALLELLRAPLEWFTPSRPPSSPDDRA